MLKSSLCDYSDAIKWFLWLSETITIDGEGVDDNAKRLDERSKRVIFKNCAPFTDCISEINNAKDVDVVMPMCNSIECKDNYSKTSETLQQCYRDDPNDILTNPESFKFKIKITGKLLLLVIQRILK